MSRLDFEKCYYFNQLKLRTTMILIDLLIVSQRIHRVRPYTNDNRLSFDSKTDFVRAAACTIKRVHNYFHEWVCIRGEHFKRVLFQLSVQIINYYWCSKKDFDRLRIEMTESRIETVISSARPRSWNYRKTKPSANGATHLYVRRLGTR
jgi:hypothetical protein